MSPIWTCVAARDGSAAAAARYGSSIQVVDDGSAAATRPSQHLMHLEVHFFRLVSFPLFLGVRGAPAAYPAALPYHTTASAGLPPASRRAAILPHSSAHAAHTPCRPVALSKQFSAASSRPASPWRLPHFTYSLAHSALALLSSTL